MFWLKKKKELEKQFLSYFNVEVADGKSTMVADISNEDIKKWLYGVF